MTAPDRATLPLSAPPCPDWYEPETPWSQSPWAETPDWYKGTTVEYRLCVKRSQDYKMWRQIKVGD